MQRPARLSPVFDSDALGSTLFFIQGWPDDFTLWDELVARVRGRYRCVRVNLPNYDGAELRRWGCSHDAIVQGLADCIRESSKGSPVTLVTHDWGAYWGYLLHHRHPELVQRMVALDVAPSITPTVREILLVAAHQWWLAVAFIVGGGLGDWMTRLIARLGDAPKRGSAVRATMNYPYFYTWRDIFLGRLQKSLAGYSPEVPILFVYGEDKAWRFHTDAWLERVRAAPSSRVVALDGTGHWVTRDPRLSAIVDDWLNQTDGASRER